MAKSSFWNFVIVVFFALAIVALGADELNRRFARQGKKQGHPKSSFIQRFFGDQGIDSVPTEKLSSKSTNKGTARSTTSFFRQDGLERSDRKELQNLLNEVDK